MKKLSFITLFILSFLFNNAQNNSNSTSNTGIFKQQAGDKSLEINFNPGQIFNSDSISKGNQFGLFNGGIKFRSFSTDKKAFRVVANISYYKNTEITQQEDTETDLLELKDKSSYFTVMLQPGFEKHFSDLNRFSPYIGFQGLIGYGARTYKSEYQDGKKIYEEKWTNYSGNGDNGSLDFGAGIFAGFDFYFVKKLYLGIELGYGFQYSKLLKTKYTDEQDGENNWEAKNGSAFGISPTLATGNLRLGWTF